ncbi:general secretion pathway protein E/type IV pilus assembly protein PilB [Methylophilus rhizosphaerae]|uniref:General secretion pathway protein E/type IV pilus assembly protein PilB n=1 Tax=Methylophilus rhizosphaerae TaxID=492660 RepID=A0A1G9E237_9PROT|nr:GspE/PulE family protein [Methylophilus rhizosphaerae]SDK70147.1 general secretion pathway protein E/type IV pilus assembly protein PilB [Methylophilus rhizosphaerae]
MSAENLQLGEWMLAKGMITADQLDIAMIEQRESGLSLGQQLVRLHFVTDAMVRDILAQHHAHESIDLRQVIPDHEVLAMVPEAFAKQHRLIPLDISPDKQVMRVAMADMNRVTVLDQLRYLLGSSTQLKPVLATEAHIEQALDKFYGHNLSLDEILHEIEQASLPQAASASRQDTRPVIRLVNAILVDAVKQGASDIHFEPEQAFLRIRYRIDGVLWQIRCLHDRYWPAMCVRLKILAGMDIAEQRIPQDGRVNLFLCGSQIDFRVSSHPTLHGENIVLRVLDRDKAIIALDAMGLRQPQLQLLQTLLEKPEGLLVLTGPTGSGKTTTLYSLLGHLNHQHVNIMTLEDPVEYPYMLMRQTSVNEANKVDFVSGIRAILRQDPDIILVGEVRDEPTAAMAMRAAMTGHLVMTTLHTNNAIAAFARLEDLGVSRQVMRGSLVGVIAQRLLRRLCPHCKVPVLPDMEIQALLESLPVSGPAGSIQLYQAGGCRQCRMSGYRGRLVIMEILVMQPELDAMLAQNPTTLALQQQARAYGYTTLAEEGLQRVCSGETSLQELRRVVDLSAYAAGVAS